MASINYHTREISCKIVYYGPGLSGKTTNLQIIHKKVPKDSKSEMVSLATETDRTLFFDFLPLDLGSIKGFSTKFQLYTVPGQVYYNATRKLVLRGVDGVVFVADSQRDKMPENLESLRNLEENLREYGIELKSTPFVLQYNKRDLPSIFTVDEMNAQINSYGVPCFEAQAHQGVGVFTTLKAIGKIVIDTFNTKYSARQSSRRPDPNPSSQGSIPAVPAAPSLAPMAPAPIPLAPPPPLGGMRMPPPIPRPIPATVATPAFSVPPLQGFNPNAAPAPAPQGFAPPAPQPQGFNPNAAPVPAPQGFAPPTPQPQGFNPNAAPVPAPQGFAPPAPQPQGFSPNAAPVPAPQGFAPPAPQPQGFSPNAAPVPAPQGFAPPAPQPQGFNPNAAPVPAPQGFAPPVPQPQGFNPNPAPIPAPQGFAPPASPVQSALVSDFGMNLPPPSATSVQPTIATTGFAVPAPASPVAATPGLQSGFFQAPPSSLQAPARKERLDGTMDPKDLDAEIARMEREIMGQPSAPAQKPAGIQTNPNVNPNMDTDPAFSNAFLSPDEIRQFQQSPQDYPTQRLPMNPGNATP